MRNKNFKPKKMLILALFASIFAITSIFGVLNLATESENPIEQEEIVRPVEIKISATDPIIHVDNNWTLAVGAEIATGTGSWGDPFVIKDMVIDGGQADYGIHIANNNSYYRIENCTVYNCNISGIFLSNANNGTVIDCNISFNYDGIPLNNKGNGIYVSGSDNNTIVNNILCNNSEYGLYIAGSSNIFQNNLIANNSRHGVNVGNTDYNKFYDNRIENSASCGLTASNGAADMIIQGNLFSDSGSVGIRFYGAFRNNVTENIIRRNNIGVDIESTSTDHLVYKNTFIDNNLHARTNLADNQFNISNVGNFWDNYTENDNSPYDGIGDIPYNYIEGAGGAIDHFPIHKNPLFNGTPIHIDETGVSSLNWSQTTLVKNWVSGSGTELDPYVIQDKIINASVSGNDNGITVGNSTEFFKIENCSIYNSSISGAGIYLHKTSNGTLQDNFLYNNSGHGIYLYYTCYNNTILRNSINTTSGNGIYLFSSCMNNTIMRNSINTTSGNGIYVRASCNYNKILNNTIYNNTADSMHGIYVYGGFKNIISNNSIYNNTGNSRHAIFLHSVSYNNTLSNNYIVQNDGNGIRIEADSAYNKLINNNILNNTGHGVSVNCSFLNQGCDLNNISSNLIYGNALIGIHFTGLFDWHGTNVIEKNNITKNGQHGIFLSWFRWGTISENIINNNGAAGNYQAIRLALQAQQSTFSGNNITFHASGGLYIQDNCENHLVFNNIFKNNSIHAMDNNTGGTLNNWNNSAVGNYWDDYFTAQGGEDLNDDNRGDKPYNVSGLGIRKDFRPIWDDGDDLVPIITVYLPNDQTYWKTPPLINVSAYHRTIQDIWYNVSGDPTKEFLANETAELLNDALWAGLPQGEFKLTINANDSVNHISQETLTLYKDTNAPLVEIVLPTNGSYWNVAPQLNISVSDLYPDKIWYNVTGNSTQIYINNNEIVSLNRFIWANLSQGIFEISIFANDLAGNENNTLFLRLYKDTIAPAISINRLFEYQDAPPDFNISITEVNFLSAWYVIIGNESIIVDITELSGTINDTLWDSLPNGTATIRFYARDLAGNIGYKDVSVTKIITTLGPALDPAFLTIVIISASAIVGAIALFGIMSVRKSKKKVRAKDEELKTLKQQREEITEDDITVSKEKHICLVHKGPIEGYNYICPGCGAYYCSNCVEALKKTENECWSCGKALDKSKPIKGLKPEEEKEEIKVDDGKKGKKVKSLEDYAKEPEKAPKALKAPKPESQSAQRLTIRKEPIEEPEPEIEPESEPLQPEETRMRFEPAEIKKEEAAAPPTEVDSTQQIKEKIQAFDGHIEKMENMVPVLEKKFKNGEITQEEYVEKRDILAEKLGEAMMKRDLLKEKLK